MAASLQSSEDVLVGHPADWHMRNACSAPEADGQQDGKNSGPSCRTQRVADLFRPQRLLLVETSRAELNPVESRVGLHVTRGSDRALDLRNRSSPTERHPSWRVLPRSLPNRSASPTPHSHHLPRSATRAPDRDLTRLLLRPQSPPRVRGTTRRAFRASAACVPPSQPSARSTRSLCAATARA
jgi:hypothetical protein